MSKYEYAIEDKKFYVVGSERHEFPEIKRVVFAHREARILIVWEGKRKKPVTNASYSTDSYFESALEWVLESCKRRVDDIKEYEEKCNKRYSDILENTKLGDIFYSTWGFEQTNVDYYQVVGIKGKKFSFQKLKEYAEYNDNHMSGKSSPIKDSFYEDEAFTLSLSKSAVFKKSSFEQLVPHNDYEIENGERKYKLKTFTCYA